MRVIILGIIVEYCVMLIAGLLSSLVFTGMGTVAIVIPIELISAAAHLSHDVNMGLYRIAVLIIFMISFARGARNYEHFWE